MEIEKLKKILKEGKEPRYRFSQIYQAIFRDLIFDFGKMTNLSKKIRERLKKEIKILSLEPLKLKKDKDTQKALFLLSDGVSIETVLMKHKDGHKTVCVSSAAGCPLECRFCATGKMGFKRNLNWQEILDQVLFFAKKEKTRKLNVVFMGMGEPFLNYENVLKAIRFLNDKKGFNLRQRAISISTAGIIPGIKRFQKEKLEVNLAISLHSPDDKVRSFLMPINKTYPLKDLILAARNYVKTTRRKLFFEYLMLKGINDSISFAQKLVKLLKGESLFHINLIKYHETQTDFLSSDKKTIFRFQKELQKHNLKVTIRHSFGEKIEAACGQLAT
ncbi:23S rRNA (adenine(2503)-C(2))-methyltransferase RlmN [Patescibacteria group bacterium]|nr:23S rRNA (adenine(2503)-C(2))-methyltransferase RlmN [Patescibacteria group bacterium]